MDSNNNQQQSQNEQHSPQQSVEETPSRDLPETPTSGSTGFLGQSNTSIAALAERIISSLTEKQRSQLRHLLTQLASDAAQQEHQQDTHPQGQQPSTPTAPAHLQDPYVQAIWATLVPGSEQSRRLASRNVANSQRHNDTAPTTTSGHVYIDTVLDGNVNMLEGNLVNSTVQLSIGRSHQYIRIRTLSTCNANIARGNFDGATLNRWNFLGEDAGSTSRESER